LTVRCLVLAISEFSFVTRPDRTDPCVAWLSGDGLVCEDSDVKCRRPRLPARPPRALRFLRVPLVRPGLLQSHRTTSPAELKGSREAAPELQRLVDGYAASTLTNSLRKMRANCLASSEAI